MRSGRLRVFRRSTLRKIWATLALLLLCAAQAQSETSVWQLQQGESVLYLGGTCHLLRRADFPLPSQFARAYGAADLVVFETDIGKANEATTLQKLRARASYGDGSSLEQHLSPQTYSLLSQYCAANGIPLTLLQPLRPVMAALTVTDVELMKLGVTQEGVDSSFYQQATRDHKKREALETIDQQIDFIVGIGEGQEDDFVAYSLKDLESIEQQYGELLEAWRSGSSDKLAHLLGDDVGSKFPRIYEKLITERNAQWLPRIEAYLRTPEKEFILVGVGHLVGPEGIIATLRRKGYKITQL